MRACLRQEGQQAARLHAEQQHDGEQQRLAPAVAVVRGRELVQIALQVRQRVRVRRAACRARTKSSVQLKPNPNPANLSAFMGLARCLPSNRI